MRCVCVEWPSQCVCFFVTYALFFLTSMNVFHQWLSMHLVVVIVATYWSWPLYKIFTLQILYITTTNNQQPNNQQTTTHDHQATTNHDQPATNNQQSTADNEQPTTINRQPTTNNHQLRLFPQCKNVEARRVLRTSLLWMSAAHSRVSGRRCLNIPDSLMEHSEDAHVLELHHLRSLTMTIGTWKNASPRKTWNCFKSPINGRKMHLRCFWILSSVPWNEGSNVVTRRALSCISSKSNTASGLS